jgi:hypothetical protein
MYSTCTPPFSALLRFERKELCRLRRAGDGVDEFRVDHRDLTIVPALIEAHQLRGNLARVLIARTIADAGEFIDDVIAARPEVADSLASDDDEIRVLRALHERKGFLAGIARVSAGKSLVARHDEQELLSPGVLFQQRILGIGRRVRRDLLHGLHDLLRIRAVALGGFLGMAQT